MLCKSLSKNIGNRKIFLALAVLTFFLLNISSVLAVTYATVEDVYGILGDGTNRTGAYNITFKVRSCDDSACSGESWSSLYTNATYNDISSLSNNQYFQYIAFFYTEDQNYTPMLFNSTIGYTKNIYPANVTLNVGNDSDTEWNQTGTFDYSVAIDDTNTTPTFTSELNDVLTNQCTCSGCELNTTDRTCKIPFVLSSATQGKINVSNINISYDLMSLNITCIDQNSNTIETALVEIFTPTGNSTAWKTAYTDSGGKASFTTITGKTYDIKSSKTGYISNTDNTNVGPNGTYTLSMTALIDYIKVYLYDNNNTPISGKTVNIYLANNVTVYQTNTTDANGYTEFFVDVQNYDLKIDPTGWNRFYEDILNPYTKRLYGLLVNVTNQNAQAVNNAQVWVYEAGTTTSYNSNTNSSGMITFGLENQSYDISTFKQGVFSRLLRQDVPSTANVELDLTVTDYLDEINKTVHSINDSITNTIIPYLSEINQTTHTSYTYLTDTIYPKVNDANSTIHDVLIKWGTYNASQLYEKINSTYFLVNGTKNETSALLSKWGSRTADELFNEVNDTEEKIQEVLDKWDSYNASQLYDKINLTYNNTQQTLTYIGNPADDESQNTLFGEHAYTQNRLSSISGNLTEVKTIVTQINITTEAINSTVSTILLEVDDLEELHQCSISPNSTICTLLNNIKTDTTNIYNLATEINTTVSSMNLFSISALIAGSPRYANEEALIEATFTGQNGSYVTPDTINVTIYDPNDNIWQSATKTQFTEGSDHIWTYSKSISATPTTGMYTVHMLASYDNIGASKSAQFRIATGGPYKVYLECPATSNVGSELVCSVILKDEGEVPTESTSTVWVDTDNNGVWDAGETQMSFSKQTVPQQNVTQSVSVNVPSSHATGLYVVRVDTSYASSSQPNSGASDTVTFGTAPAGDTGGDTGGGSSGGGGITGKATEVICNPPYIRYEEGCCLDANNNSICDVDEGLPAEEEIPEGETKEELPDGKSDFLDIKINKKYILIGAGALVFILLLIFVLIKIFKHGSKSGKVKYLDAKLKHLKELKTRKEISKSSYHSERERLLNKINKILKGKHLVLILGAVGLITLFSIMPRPSITGGAIRVGESNLGAVSWWFVLGTLAVLSLIGIFVVLIYILREIKKFTTGKASFVSAPKSYLDNNLNTIKQTNKIINTKSSTNSLNGLINKKVFTDSGNYIGEVKEALLGENKIDSLKIMLDKHQGFNVKGIIIKYNNVKSIGHVVVVEGILEKIDSWKD